MATHIALLPVDRPNADKKYRIQDLVFSVKLHFGLTIYPLSLPLVPYPLVLFLSRNLGEGYCDCCDCDCCCYCPLVFPAVVTCICWSYQKVWASLSSWVLVMQHTGHVENVGKYQAENTILISTSNIILLTSCIWTPHHGELTLCKATKSAFISQYLASIEKTRINLVGIFPPKNHCHLVESFKI